MEENKNKKLKVVFLPYWYPNKTNPLAAIFIKERAEAVSLYDDVVVIYNEGYGREKTKISDAVEDGIRTIRITNKFFMLHFSSYLGYLWTLRMIFKNLIKENGKPDIIHSYIYSASIPAVILGKIYHIPVVATEYSSEFLVRSLDFFKRMKAKFGLSQVEMILPDSKSLEVAMKSYGIKNNYRVIPNAIDENIFYPSTTTTDTSDKKRILFVGNLKKEKGLIYLFEALATIKKQRRDFILDVVGAGELDAEYKKKVQELGLNDLVRFHGQLSRRQTAEYMRRSDFCVLPSLWESFNIVSIEVMACGKPIVATSIPAFVEKIDKTSGILVEKENAVELAKAIVYMLDHYTNYSASEISEKILQKFSKKKIAETIDTIYREIIRNGT